MAKSGTRVVAGERVVLGAGAACAIALLFAGWREFGFLTDDAYIAFRYVSNLVLGRGLVWNPEPFVPVEGYTSLLWILLLALVWKTTGVAPPESANALSLLCGLGSVFLAWRLVMRMSLPAALDRRRASLSVLVLIGISTSRTYLTWLSSGLETALFGLLVTWWVYEALSPPERCTLGWSARLSAAAALASLARPDGLLLVAACLPLLGRRLVHLRGRAPLTPFFVSVLPLLITPVHLLWRRAYYGMWLPNTYYAKYSSPWPESGLRYLASFLVEQGTWMWVLLAVAWLAMRIARRDWLSQGSPSVPVVAAALGAHFLYYTFVIGGDHFEYRVYAHLVPLFLVSGVWMLGELGAGSRLAHGVVIALILASYPVAWTHWAQTRGFSMDRAGDFIQGYRPVSPHFPAPLRPLVEPWDRWQAWMNERFVGTRQHQHHALTENLERILPDRKEGASLSWDQRPVAVSQAVGVIGWRYPNVAVIDFWGLNDRVVSRTPPHGARVMAHSRMPPSGYAECFDPNVVVTEQGVQMEPRTRPLTDERIRWCEQTFWDAALREAGPGRAVAPIAGGRTIDGIFADKKALSGTVIAVRGRVEKVNVDIMEHNWVHLSDGGKNRLVVTTAALPAVGQTVVARGRVGVDRTFGASYNYPVLLEDAEVFAE